MLFFVVHFIDYKKLFLLKYQHLKNKQQVSDRIPNFNTSNYFYRYKKWVEFAKNPNINTNSFTKYYMCARHFDETHLIYKNDNGLSKEVGLQPYAVSLFWVLRSDIKLVIKQLQLAYQITGATKNFRTLSNYSSSGETDLQLPISNYISFVIFEIHGFLAHNTFSSNSSLLPIVVLLPHF